MHGWATLPWDRDLGAVYVSAEAKIPLVVSLPHVGTGLAPEVAEQLLPLAANVEDTDWHVERLYEFARIDGAGWVQACLSRYVIDLNRPPDDASLYPGQTTSALCPRETFAGTALYWGEGPDSAEVARRRARYWEPYHVELQRIIADARKRFGWVVLLDAHSIASEVPRLFDGLLPDINVGTYGGRSCARQLQEMLLSTLQQQNRFTHVTNGRFQGGYITRRYGAPDSGIHAVQLELGQRAYLGPTAAIWDPGRANDLIDLLRALVADMVAFRP